MIAAKTVVPSLSQVAATRGTSAVLVFLMSGVRGLCLDHHRRHHQNEMCDPLTNMRM